ncbi:MAG: DHH family phosphoesterase [Bdellovibrionales bacterium]|nr:DHH family phosphoesterase [Bdellovibrionales bacterium]
MNFNSIALSEKILQSQSFVLTTHKNCDADGLGSILAFHHVLTKLGKKVQSLAVDDISKRYDFMNHQDFVSVYQKNQVATADVALIFDTNDPRLVEPLYSELKQKTKTQIFIDHHSPLSFVKDINMFLDENAASTGELCYTLFEEMKVPVTKEVARALYISIIFDTGMFRSSKNLSGAFYTCSKLCHQVDINQIYEELFCRYDQISWKGMMDLLSQVQYSADQKVAFIECDNDSFKKLGVSVFHILDALDLVMKQKSVLVGFVSIEKSPGQYKLSFRSKQSVSISRLAEELGGGGHEHSAGATVKDYSKEKILGLIKKWI